MDSNTFSNKILIFSDKLYRMANSILLDEEAAKDCVQDIYVKLWEKRNGLNKVKNLSSVFFVKTLSCRETDTVLLKQLKVILKTEKYELVKKIKNECNNSETYQKKSENKDFEQITFNSNQMMTYIRWVSGKSK